MFPLVSVGPHVREESWFYSSQLQKQKQIAPFNCSSLPASTLQTNDKALQEERLGHKEPANKPVYTCC